MPRALEGNAMSLNDLLSDEPFSYLATKSGLVQISYKGKTVTTLSGRNSSRFLAKVSSADSQSAQLAMAKATGHFKHGSERVSKNQNKPV
jgi:hypothetical protein